MQRSFRLSRDTAELIDRSAETTGETRNALVDRLLGEAVRTTDHPLVGFRTGAAGQREPALVGTRLLVRQVVATVRGHDGDKELTAELLGVPIRAVRAAIAYYADFRDEVDADAERAHRVEDAERARWERQQAALG